MRDIKGERKRSSAFALCTTLIFFPYELIELTHSRNVSNDIMRGRAKHLKYFSLNEQN